MLTRNFAMLKQRVEAHIAADTLIQGEYWDDEAGNGCFIGCLAELQDGGDAVAANEAMFGLPAPLQRICDRIHESIPYGRMIFEGFPAAIGRDGKDLSRVHWAFLAETLRNLPHQSPEFQTVIDAVIDGMDLLAAGKDWSGAEEAALAARAAANVADAARAAADAARAASYATAARAAADADANAARATANAARAAYWAARAADLAANVADAAYWAALAAYYAAYAAACYAANAAGARAADARDAEWKRQAESVLKLIKEAK